jgi:hypothetical protein
MAEGMPCRSRPYELTSPPVVDAIDVASRVEQAARRQSVFREFNENIAALTGLHIETGYNLFVCECSDTGCAEPLEITARGGENPLRRVVQLRLRRRDPAAARRALHRLSASGPVPARDRLRASQTGVAIAEDLASGMIDRFRALPIAAAAVLAGRVAADAVRNLFVVALMIAVGSAMGFRFHAGPAAALAAVAFALAVSVGLAFSWLNLLLGLLVRNPESAGLAGIFPVIILVFTSSMLVPVATMPGWLQAFANVNPVTALVDALRVLCLGGPAAVPVLEALPGSGGSSSSPSRPPSSATGAPPPRN